MSHKGGTWGVPVPNSVAFARVGGRKKYNALRQFEARLRQIEVTKLMNAMGWKKGCQRQIARHLGVSNSTISRDVKAILAELEV